MKYNLTPEFINIKMNMDNQRARDAWETARTKWIKSEIKMHYKVITECELKTYNLHMELTERLSYEMIDFVDRVDCVVEAKANGKYNRIKRKLRLLKQNQSNRIRSKPPKMKPEYIQEFVVNRSSYTFDQDELELLNKGLKFAMPPTKNQVDEIICDIAANIHVCEDPVIDRIELDVANVLSSTQFDNNVLKFKRTIDKIKEKSVYITKADKSNNIVVQDKRAYDESARALLNGGDYEMLSRNPLNNIVSEVKTTLKFFTAMMVRPSH